MNFSEPELDAIIAGLRLPQRTDLPGTSLYNVPTPIYPLLYDDDDLPPTGDELDDLIERINCGDHDGQ